MITLSSAYNQCSAPTGPTLSSGNVYSVRIDCTGVPIYPGGQSAYRKEVQFRIASSGAWDPTNDWSYAGVATTPGSTPVKVAHIPLYDAGVRVFGLEPTSDTNPPTTPTALRSTSVTMTSVALAWTASADDVAVTSYDVYRGTTLAGSSTTTTFTDSSLVPGTAYSYTVRARDAAGNASGPSSALAVTTLTDTTAPTAPAGLTSPSKTSTSVSLSWTASTDNVGVSGYDVYRATTLAGSSTTTSFTDSGLTANTTYSYTVRARDAAGNLSMPSAALSVTTAGVDTTAPTAPAGLTSPAKTSTSVSLSWTASTDNVGVTGYSVYRGTTLAGSNTATSFTDTGLTPNTSYSYTVTARDAAGNVSAASAALSVTTDNQVPVTLKVQYRAADTNATDNQIKPHLNVVNTGTTSVALSELTVRYWYTKDTAQTQVYDCDYAVKGCSNIIARFGTPTTTSAAADTYLELGFTTAAGSLAAGQQTGEIQNRVHNQNWSSYNEANDYSFDPTKTAFADWARVTLYRSGVLVWGVEPVPVIVDTQAPTAPTNLASPAKTSTSVSLSWTASTDNVGVTGYRILEGTAEVAASTTPSSTVTGLAPSSTHTYTVVAFDAAGNVSAASNAVTVTTDSTPQPGLKVQYRAADTNATDNQIKPHLNVVNTGTTSVALNELTVRYWYTKDTTQTQVYDCDYAAKSCSNIVASFGTPTTITSTADTYLQIGFTAAAGSLAAGQQTGEIQNRIHNQNWANYNEANDYSFDPTKTAFADWNRVTLYRNGLLVWGIEPVPVVADTQPPTAPTNLASPSKTSTTVSLSWTASTDNIGVTGYDVYRGTTFVGSSPTTSFTDIGLTANAAYSYTVRAKDAAGNVSTPSAALSVTTDASTAGAAFRVNAQGRIAKNGELFPVRCGSWFGLQGRYEPASDSVNPRGAPMELYIGNTFWANGGAGTGRTIQQTMTEITAAGINVVRMPVVHQTLDANDPQGRDPYLKNHPSVRVANSRLALEQWIKAAAQNNIQVILDIHSCSNYVDWRKGRLDARPPWADATRDNYDFKREDCSCAATNNPSTVTRIQAHDETLWLNDLRTLAGLGQQLGVDNIIGIDIFNEPWDYTWQEWKTLAEHAFQAINEVNPNTLLFVQGIGATAGNQDGTPATFTQTPHGDPALNPNWGENLFEAGANPPNIPKDRLVFSPHTYGPSVFVQKMFMDPAQPQCAGLEGDAAGDAKCNIVINPTLLRLGWEEHFGYLKDLGYAVVVGEFGGNLDWPAGQASLRDRARWSHITPGVDAEWQNAFVDYMAGRGIEGCYWSINPESGDTGGWYGHAYDPVSNTAGWGEWRDFDQRKTDLLLQLWGAN